jgi:hypothetical protein
VAVNVTGWFSSEVQAEEVSATVAKGDEVGEPFAWKKSPDDRTTFVPVLWIAVPSPLTLIVFPPGLAADPRSTVLPPLIAIAGSL